MTAWHDQPPVSRRQVRQTERDENVDPQSTPDQADPGQTNPGQTNLGQTGLRQTTPEDTSFAGIARQGWEAEARRASAPQGAPESRAESGVTRGRRVQQPATNERAADTEPEPLAYITQARPQVPSYDGASFRGRAISALPPGADLSERDEARSAQDQPEFRNREFSPPETGRSAFRPAGPPLHWAPPSVITAPQPIDAAAIAAAPPAPSAEASGPEPVLTRRQMRELGIGGFVKTPTENDEAELAAATAASAHAQAEAVPVVEAPVQALSAPAVPVQPVTVEGAFVTERPRFRDRASRATVDPELEREEASRAQRSTDSTQAPHTPDEPVAEPPALVEPPLRALFSGAIPTLIVEAPGAAVPAAHNPVSDMPASDITVAEIVEASPAPSDGSPIHFVSTPVFAADSVVEPEVVVAELEPHQAEAPAFEDLLFPGGQPVETMVEPEHADAVPMTFEAFLGAQQAPAPGATDASPSHSVAAADDTYVPPVGHWSTQALIDDDEQVQENTFARDVGATSGAITTSALVLPSMPTGEDIMGPLSGTGEILITGSVSLPSSMGTTGVHPARYDHSDVDALLEADDREDSDPESAPVRAIRAISTNTASGDVINSMKPRKASRLPLVLIVSAAVMAVGVVVLLVAGFIFKIF